MLIILEGPDGAGKTTLARRLADYIKSKTSCDEAAVRVRHAGPPRHHPLWEYVAPLVTYRPGTGRHVICDRWHIGEAVYPGILGRRTYLDPAVRSYIELFLASRGAVIVHVTDGVQALRERLASRGDDMITPDMIESVRDRFVQAVRGSLSSKWQVSTIDVFAEDDALLELLFTSAQTAERDAHVLNDYVTYVGRPKIGLLLLGDIRGKNGAYTDSSVPAFMPYASTSGHYLLAALAGKTATVNNPTKRWPMTLGLANACDVDNVPNMLDALGNPRVVALGRNASIALSGLGVAFTSVEHPQYRRRFHYAEAEDYARQIWGVCT